MKKLIFPLVVIILLAWIFVGKCKQSGLTEEFKAKQDSLVHVVDSLEVDIEKSDSIIGELYETNLDLNYDIMNQEEKVITITKWVDSSKGKVDTYSEAELITSFNQRYPEDTTTNPLPLAQPVLVNAAKDLIELDGAKETLIVKDSIIVLTEGKVAIRDGIIVEFQNKENNYKGIISVKDTQLKDWQDQYKQIQSQNKKLKLRMQLSKVGAGLAIGGLTFLLIK